MIKTNFGGRSFEMAMDENLPEYAPTAEAMGRLFGKLAANPSAPEAVADVIWAAANDTSDQLRFRAGADADKILDARKIQDDAEFIGSMKNLMRD